MSEYLLGIGCAALVTLLFYNNYWKRRHLPPGPTPLPIFGNVLSFAFTDMDVQLARWKERYGDVMTMWMGPMPVVTLHDPKLIVDTFVKDGEAYAGRPYFSWNDLLRDGFYGIVFNEGEIWRENRRFALQVFRNFGMGRQVMQERTLNEVTRLLDFFNSKTSENGNSADGVNIHDELDLAIGSIINDILFGYPFTRDKLDEFKQAKKYANDIVSDVGRPLFLTMINDCHFWKRFPLFRGEYAFIEKQAAEVKAFFHAFIDRHLETLDLERDDEPTDFVEAFLRHKHKLEKEGHSDHLFSMKQLYATVLDLWIAGQETTSNTLAWLCVYLIEHPEVQLRMQAELDSVIGEERLVTLDDRSQLPFVNAVVAETQRFCNLLPFNATHRLTRPVTIAGYHLPKDAVVVHQVSTVHSDDRFFPQPERFWPERFIDADGKFVWPPELMPFGVGKRSCLGESMARVELFLFTANIFHHFSLSAGSTYKKPKRIITGTITPSTFLCKLQRRR